MAEELCAAFAEPSTEELEAAPDYVAVTRLRDSRGAAFGEPPVSDTRGDGSTAYPPAMRPDELERRLRKRQDALGPASRAELLHVLMLPDFDRADRIGS